MEIVGKWVGSAVVGKPLVLVFYYYAFRILMLCSGVEPKYMGISPIFAVPKVLAQLGLSKEDIDVYEVSMTVPMSNLGFNISYNRSMKHLHHSSPTAWRN